MTFGACETTRTLVLPSPGGIRLEGAPEELPGGQGFQGSPGGVRSHCLRPPPPCCPMCFQTQKSPALAVPWLPEGLWWAPSFSKPQSSRLLSGG